MHRWALRRRDPAWCDAANTSRRERGGTHLDARVLDLRPVRIGAGNRLTDRLLAASGSAQLTAEAWNWAPGDAQLEPLTAYWLVYNSNGRTGAVNNTTFQWVTGNIVDAAVQTSSTARCRP